MTVQTLTGPRLSSLAHGCARQVYYQAKGAPATPPSTQMERWFRRGHVIGGAIADELTETALGRVYREVEIPWPAGDPIGTGHADVYVENDKRIVEITSTTGSSLAPHKARQAALYALNHPDAEEAYVCSVDPASWIDKWYPIDWEALAPEITALQDEAVAGIREDLAPERCCSSPADAQGYFCPYADHCFAGFEYPPTDEILDPETVSLVDRLAFVEDSIRMVKADLKDNETLRDELRDQLRPYIPAGEQVRAGSHLVKRGTHVRHSFSLTQAAAAGKKLPEDLEPFVTESEVERWQPIKTISS